MFYAKKSTKCILLQCCYNCHSVFSQLFQCYHLEIYLVRCVFLHSVKSFWQGRCESSGFCCPGLSAGGGDCSRQRAPQSRCECGGWREAVINAAVPFTVSERQGGISILNMKSSQCVSGVAGKQQNTHLLNLFTHTCAHCSSAVLVCLHAPFAFIFPSLRASTVCHSFYRHLNSQPSQVTTQISRSWLNLICRFFKRQ